MLTVESDLRLRSCRTPQCQTDLALLTAVASLERIDPRLFFSKAHAAKLLKDVSAQADRVIISALQGTGSVASAMTQMLHKHGRIFVKPFSFGAAHDGCGVVAVSPGPVPGTISIKTDSKEAGVRSIFEFSSSYCAAVGEKSVGGQWQIGIEECLDIYPNINGGTKEIRFLLGADPSSGQPKIYGCYGETARGPLASNGSRRAIVDAKEIIREVTQDPFDGEVLFRRCRDVALSCSESMSRGLEGIAQRYPELSYMAEDFPLTPRHLCVDIVLAKRRQGLVEPVVLEVQYPPGAGSDLGVRRVDPEAHRVFGEEFDAVVERDISRIRQDRRGYMRRAIVDK